MERVARVSVCISDLPITSPEPGHLLYTREFFDGWQLSDMLYQTDKIPPEKRRYYGL